MISIGRFLLCMFAAISIYVDPGQPTGDFALTFGIIAAYLAFAAVLAILILRGFRGSRLGVVSHVIDITFFATLIHLTDGVASPFFVYFTFVLFTAAIGWDWRGAAITTAATVAVYLSLTVVGDADVWQHIDRIVIRVSYLVVAGLFFCYFAAAAQASRLRLARLADWPLDREDGDAEPSVVDVLTHAAAILKLSRIVAVWELDGIAHGATFDNGGSAHRTLPRMPRLDYGPRPKTLAATELQPLRDEMAELLGMVMDIDETCAAIPLPDAMPGCYLLLFGRGRFPPDFLTLGSIVATRVGAVLKRVQLRRQLILNAAAQERTALARDIHDDILQTLTAIALQLKTMEDGLAPHSRQQLAAIRGLVTYQQRQLRRLITENGADAGGAGEAPLESISDLLTVLRAQWNCEIELRVPEVQQPLAKRTLRDIELFIAEAVANGVRHGKATRFSIALALAADQLEIRIEDDGKGIEGADGSFDHDTVMRTHLGSSSLRKRVEAAGWRLTISSSPSGTSIMVQIPPPLAPPDQASRPHHP